MLLLFMLSCLTCALTPTNEDEITFIECGDIVPVNPFFFIGERLVLTCALWNIDNNKTVSLYFDMAVNNNGRWSNVEVNQSGYEIIQLNSTTVQLTSPVLTVDDARRHSKTKSYRCMVQEVVNECTRRNNKFVTNKTVKIDYFPHKPENFSCQVYNWEELTCTWDMIPYFHEEDITVNCFWKSDLLSRDSRTWSSEFSEKTFTSFTMDSFSMMPKYWFYFNITNKIRSILNTSALFDISPSKIVKPAPVDYISFPNLNDTCVTMVWNHSKRFRKKVFRVRCTSKCSTERQITTQEMKVTICDLNPYTNYTFVVDSRPMYLDLKGNSLDTIGFTSDPRDSSVITKSAVPAANPRLLSYTDVQCPNSPCRKVLVYWEPLSPCDLHDSPSGLQYEIITKQRESVKTWNSTVNEPKAISHLLMLPDEEKVYDVMLRVITGTGKKREDFSHMVIWPRKQSPVAPSMVVEYDTQEKHGTNFYITLDLTEAQSQTSQILYWCRGLRGNGCQEPMSFREINGISTEIFVGNYVMDFNFRFGVESQQLLLGEITRSGIQMVSCMYRKDQKPLVPPKNFHIAKGIAEREGELSLQWDPYNCNSPDFESGYVQNYTLYYCQVTDEASCNLNSNMLEYNAISMKQDIRNYTIRKLKPGGRYKVWLRAMTSAGEGPSTDAIDTYIYIQEFPLWSKVIIGVGSLIASLVILICFVKFQQYLKERRKAFSVIEVPDTRMRFTNGSNYFKIPVPIGHMHHENGHVIVDDQSDKPIPDKAESEELSRIIPLIPNGNAQVSMTNNSSSNSLLLEIYQSEQLLMDSQLFSSDHQYYVSCISSNDLNSACSGIESDRDIKDEKETTQAEHGYQNTNLIPEGYCRAVGNGDDIPNGKTNPTLYEDRLDNKFFKLQGQAVHSHSIDSLLNDGPELQRSNIILLDYCKGNICERDKNVHSVCVKDSSNLPQENVTIERQIERGWMKSKDESDELVLSSDDDAASDDSLSLWDEICRSPDKTEMTSGYVCASKIHYDAEETIYSFNHWKYPGYSSLGKDLLGSDDDHVKHEIDNARSENDHVISDADLITPVHCDYVNFSIGDSVRLIHKHKICGNRIKMVQHRNLSKSFVSHGTSAHDNPRVEDHDPAVIHPYMNIVQSGIPEYQLKDEWNSL